MNYKLETFKQSLIRHPEPKLMFWRGIHTLETFKQTVWDFYKENKRDFAWRQTVDPYKIVVSEIMLQQTQTHRVAPKFELFIQKFPTFQALANASTPEVLMLWVGLGYNRRALALHSIAQRVMEEYNGQLPDSVETLKTFKGLGHATASSIVAFAFNKPTEFIETNIRAVYLHTFFNHQEDVHDKELWPFVCATLDKENPREWYYALMDYGVHLKKFYKNPSKKSKHYATQSPFNGSDRQVRGAIVRLLLEHKNLASQELINFLFTLFPDKQDNFESIIAGMLKENFIKDLQNGLLGL